MADDLEHSPIFICGTIRSGTTLLMSLLDGHPELLVNFGESHFFLRFLPAYHPSDEIINLTLAEKILLEPWELDNSYYKHFLSSVSCDDVKEQFRLRISQLQNNPKPSDYLAAAIFAYGKASNQLDQRRYWVEKTPYNEQFAHLIFKWWPDAKCIHMIRDPRDFLATLKNRAQKRKRKIPSVGSAAYTWRRSVQLLEKNRQKYGSKHYLSIRYEDLVTFPEREISRITAYLGITENGLLFRPTKGQGEVPWKGNAIERKFVGISQENVGRWKDQLTHKEVELLEALLSSEMQKNSYEAETCPSLPAMLKAIPIKMFDVIRTMRS